MNKLRSAKFMPKAIGELIPTVIQQATHKHRAIHELQRKWPRIVGKELARHTRPVSLRKGTLCVHADDPGANFALSLEKPKAIERLNASGGLQIEEMVIRAGE